MRLLNRSLQLLEISRQSTWVVVCLEKISYSLDSRVHLSHSKSLMTPAVSNSLHTLMLGLRSTFAGLSTPRAGRYACLITFMTLRSHLLREPHVSYSRNWGGTRP